MQSRRRSWPGTFDRARRGEDLGTQGQKPLLPASSRCSSLERTMDVNGRGRLRQDDADAAAGCIRRRPGGSGLLGRAARAAGAEPARAEARGRRRVVRRRAAALRARAARLHPPDRRVRSPTPRPDTASRPSWPPGWPRAARRTWRSSPSRACCASMPPSTCSSRSTASRQRRGRQLQPGLAPARRRPDGRLYGVWFKAANKSLIWYNVDVFERAGVAPPTDVDGLVRLAHRLARLGHARVLGRRPATAGR